MSPASKAVVFGMSAISLPFLIYMPSVIYILEYQNLILKLYFLFIKIGHNGLFLYNKCNLINNFISC
jgi:hypothetical protein